ncbi:MAG TPA: di-heme oxidoredictase family protein [Acidobacteriota bacterium]
MEPTQRKLYAYISHLAWLRRARKIQAPALILSGAVLIALILLKDTVHSQSSTPTEAPTGFDSLTNGLVTQAEYDRIRAEFEDVQTVDSGLGPVYNAQSCAECHQNPVTGGISQVTELRAGHVDGPTGRFVEAPGGSLINDRAIDASYQERVPTAENVRTLRTSLNTLGDGFVEAIDDNALIAISNRQPASMRGQVIFVPVVEAPAANVRVGRFGWKDQHASLLSFSGDAYLNEMGITSRLFPTENTSLGRPVAELDGVSDPEDVKNDVDLFAEFIRATKAPPRDTEVAATAEARIGSALFDVTGCNTCHVRSITTAPAGTAINGGTFVVPAALGNKIIHPFGDFLLHDVGTGDGIVQNGGQSTRHKVRTAPLWGVRTRSRLMHDGQSLTFTEAILRHGGEATPVINIFRILPSVLKQQLIAFLLSL